MGESANDLNLKAAAITVATSDDKAAVDAAFNTLVDGMARAINGISHSHYARGIDSDDIRQTCLMTLWECCKDYNPQFPFVPFAAESMRNKVCTFIRHCNIRRQEPLNKSSGYHPPTSDDGSEWDDSQSDVLVDRQPDPEPAEQFKAVHGVLVERLTEVERFTYEAFRDAVETDTLYSHSGELYGNLKRIIRTKHGKRWSGKRIDNALMRVRRKARGVYQQTIRDDEP